MDPEGEMKAGRDRWGVGDEGRVRWMGRGR